MPGNVFSTLTNSGSTSLIISEHSIMAHRWVDDPHVLELPEHEAVISAFDAFSARATAESLISQII